MKKGQAMGVTAGAEGGGGSVAGSAPKASAAAGPGSVNDALDPLVNALTAAGKAAMTESAGDPKVVAAVKLGWLMKELTQGWSLNPLPAGLPSGGMESFEAQAVQLTRLLELLKPGADAAAVTAVTNALSNGPAREPAKALEARLIVGLAGTDARFPTAYALGSGLRALNPGTTQGAAEQSTKIIVDALDALSSHLPSHAARSVANSLGKWSLSSDAQKSALTDSQVNLWRSVLVGEKKGTELLEPGDYLAAAKQLETHYVRRAVTSPWLWGFVGLAVALFAGGIVVLFVDHGNAGEVAGASGVLAALGLTWKGVGGTLGKLVGKLEAPLWGAELDTAITNVITLTEGAKDTSDSTPKRLGYADRRQRALSKPTAE